MSGGGGACSDEAALPTTRLGLEASYNDTPQSGGVDLLFLF